MRIRNSTHVITIRRPYNYGKKYCRTDTWDFTLAFEISMNAQRTANFQRIKLLLVGVNVISHINSCIS